jgi:hypothetical protein
VFDGLSCRDLTEGMAELADQSHPSQSCPHPCSDAVAVLVTVFAVAGEVASRSPLPSPAVELIPVADANPRSLSAPIPIRREVAARVDRLLWAPEQDK